MILRPRALLQSLEDMLDRDRVVCVKSNAALICLLGSLHSAGRRRANGGEVCLLNIGLFPRTSYSQFMVTGGGIESSFLL